MELFATETGCDGSIALNEFESAWSSVPVPDAAVYSAESVTPVSVYPLEGNSVSSSSLSEASVRTEMSLF